MKKAFYLTIILIFSILLSKDANALIITCGLFSPCESKPYCGQEGFVDPPQCKLSASSSRICDVSLDFVGYSPCVNGISRPELSPYANCYPAIAPNILMSCKRPCIDDDYTYSDWWSQCIDNNQTRNFKLIGNCEGGVEPQNSRSCEMSTEGCLSFVYSDWSTCSPNNIQLRNILSSFPSNCIGGNQILSQSCTYTVNQTDPAGIGKTDIVATIDNEVKKSVISEVLNREQTLVTKKDNQLVNRLKGKILLQVESKGEAWYVNPNDGKKIYMADGSEAYNLMRDKGIGITNKNLEKINNDKTFAKKNSGKIFLQVEARGEAYYIDSDGATHYLKDGSAAYDIMRSLGLGISNKDIRKIEVNTSN